MKIVIYILLLLGVFQSLIATQGNPTYSPSSLTFELEFGIKIQALIDKHQVTDLTVFWEDGSSVVVPKRELSEFPRLDFNTIQLRLGERRIETQSKNKKEFVFIISVYTIEKVRDGDRHRSSKINFEYVMTKNEFIRAAAIIPLSDSSWTYLIRELKNDYYTLKEEEYSSIQDFLNKKL
ncbi:MAG: hypothetical protein ACPGSB_01650 [Opitutales bacterium]